MSRGVQNTATSTDTIMDTASEAATAATTSNGNGGDIDEGLYSRQLYVMGRDAQRAMQSSAVLICGMGGLGVEIAKNVILAGVSSVVVHDPTLVEARHLGSQFYLSESHVGTPRAEACVASLASLNQYVRVSSYGGKIDDAAFLGQFSVVVMTQGTLEEMVAVDEHCHANGIKFIGARISGLFCYSFCDFGPAFVVKDQNGEPAVSRIVAGITKGTPGVVTVHDESRHGLETGDLVTFSEVAGMAELNGAEPMPIVSKGPYTFEIPDTSAFGEYTSGGYVSQVKAPKTLAFRTLKACLAEPNLAADAIETDFAKFGRSSVLHVGFRALDAVGAAGADAFLSSCREIAARIPGGVDIDDNAARVLAAMAKGSGAELAPMSAFLGGVVGQEVLKACSGKFTPVKQWLYFDAIECLPDGYEELPESEFAPENSRYDDQIKVFGKAFVSQLREQSAFLVGAGAIGCEMLKNLALMGVATSPTDPSAYVHVTDMDSIEKSNLNRQFLFRPKDVGSAKSKAAASAVMAMNPSFRVKAYEDRVGGESENLFNDDFMESLDAVITALDNVEARLYMDQRCVNYCLPLLESGTLGTKGNTQVVVPHLTENYGATRDPPEKSIPICTLKNFPHKIEHTIQWARDWFEGAFAQPASNVNSYLTDSSFLPGLDSQPNIKIETLTSLLDCLVEKRPYTFDECIIWARLEFERQYCNTIKQLLHSFPPGMLTTTGTPFWSGTKRQPKVVEFDVNDPLHLDFVVAAANLRAANYGLKGETDLNVFRKVLPAVMVPEFQVKQVKIAENDEELKRQQEESSMMVDADSQATDIIKKLPSPQQLAGYRMVPAEFEKDDDANFHMDFITAASNLRARNYAIAEADKHKTKLVAGKIIPAIATTTALVTGLVCLELYKLVDGKRDVESYKCGFVNLALPLFAFSEPVKCETYDAGTWQWSLWDKVVIDGSQTPLTLQQFCEYFQEHYDCEVNMLSYGVSILHSFFSAPAKRKARMVMTMPELVEHVTKKPLDPSMRLLPFEVCCVNADDEDVDLPPVMYKMR